MHKQQQKTVQFSNLSEDHKAEFIHFLIKNNICFQEGKDNCTAKVAVKNPLPQKEKIGNKENSFIKKNISSLQQQKAAKKETKGNRPGNQKIQKPLKDIALPNQTIIRQEKSREERELKTPTKKNNALQTSSHSCKAASHTLHKNKKTTPRSGKPNFTLTNDNNKVSQYDSKTLSFAKTFNQGKSKHESTKGKSDRVHEKQGHIGIQQHRHSQNHRERPFNKYHHLFEGVEKGRAVRWPINMLQRSIEQIYDEIFTRNTQCLQNKNIDHALKALNLSTFPQLVEHYFHKKFKSNKLSSTNLNNMLYSLSYHMSKDSSPVFLRTFQDFLTDKLQHEDTLYYLFARNVLKKELKAIEKAREQSRHEGTYFPEGIKVKQISKLLKCIIGRDSQLIIQYKQLVMPSVNGDQIEAYEFLKILLDDFHSRRIINSELEFTQSTQNPLFENENSYSQRNEQLTFGQEQYQPNPTHTHIQNPFWQCMRYSNVQDNLMELILEKLSAKSMEFLQILASDMNQPPKEMQKLQKLLLTKSQNLVRAVFEMNKMKWLKQLNITNPDEQDMATIQNLQIRLKKLRQTPTGKDIGEFCKNILTVEQLVNELEATLTSHD